MTCAELELALEQQQAENATLRAELAKARMPLVVGTTLPNKAQLLLLMQALYPAVVLSDTAGRVTWVNEGFTTLCGFELHEVVGQQVAPFVRPALDDLNMLEYIRVSWQAEVPFQYEVCNVRPGGGSYWMRVKVQPIYNEQHELLLFAGLLEDITDWKKTQLSLAASESRFQVLAENVPGVLYEWHETVEGISHFTYISPKLCELFGIASHDIGRIMDFVHPDDAAALRQSILHADRRQIPWAYECRVVVPGQPLRWMRSNFVATARDETGVKYSGIIQDITLLKLAENALRESDLRWRLTAEGFGDGAWEMHLPSCDIVFFSVDYKAMLGYRDEEFSNEYATWLAHIHPEDVAEALRATAACLCGDSALVAFEYRMRCKNGTYKWLLNRALVTARDAAGQALVFSGLHTDISELKNTKEALSTTSRQLSAVIADFQEGLVLEDENRDIVLANDAFCGLLGVSISPAQLLGKAGTWLAEGSKIHVDNPDEYVARIAGLLQSQKPVVGDVLTLRDGRTLQRDYTPIYDQHRHIGHLWKYADITTRTKTYADLRRREEKYRGIIENMSLGLVEVDIAGHILYVNRSFCVVTGYDEGELVGREWAPFFFTGSDLTLVTTKDAHIREQGVSESYEISITTKAGEVRWLLVGCAPFYDDHQQLTGSIGITLDVTPQKLLEANLREAKGLAEISSRAKQDFLANMSHEIRTPMNAIVGMSQLLAKTALNGTQASYLHGITASADNLLVIINDILDMSKIDAGHLAIEHIGFSASDVCRQIEKNFRSTAEEKGLSFNTYLDPALPVVLLGDPYRITQILLNLAGNSVKFTERGTVSVNCVLLASPTAGEALVEFTVQDSGVGINADYLAQVFDDFSQEDSSVTRKFGGTGLGLGISKKLVALLGGELRIESEKNRGTTSRFVLCLPVGTKHDVPQREGPNLNCRQHALHGKHILLVEDNLFNRMLATVFLTNAKLLVTEAANGQVAVELAGKQQFDLVLMDVQMPVMNGYEATALLRQQLGRAVPIIALTANAITGERAKCLAAGMDDYLAKPFQEAALVQMVCDWVLGPPKQ